MPPFISKINYQTIKKMSTVLSDLYERNLDSSPTAPPRRLNPNHYSGAIDLKRIEAQGAQGQDELMLRSRRCHDKYNLCIELKCIAYKL